MPLISALFSVLLGHAKLVTPVFIFAIIFRTLKILKNCLAPLLRLPIAYAATLYVALTGRPNACKYCIDMTDKNSKNKSRANNNAPLQ